MKSLLLSLLAFFARMIVSVKKPYIIGVTGTVGKTTITCWIAELLRSQYGRESVMVSERNYNGEYGLPLTIIDAPSPGRNPFLWIWTFILATIRLFRPYPRYLVLEYGIDHPGEMSFLLSIAVPDIAILTEITPNHTLQFGTFDAYLHEKLLLVVHAKQAIVHEKMRDSIAREAIYYGFGALSYVDASSIRAFPDHTDFSLHIDMLDYEVSLPFPGEHQIMNILPLFAVADVLGIHPLRVCDLLPFLSVGAGRGRVISGVNQSLILDGSYNAGYKSLSSGIQFVSRFADSHEIVLMIGDMRELGGELTPHFHEAIAHEIITLAEGEKYFARIFLVGENMMQYTLPLLEPLYKEKVIHSLSSREIGKRVREFLEMDHRDQVIVYVKGSQNTIFLEEGIKEFLRDPNDISKLCRQSQQWMKEKERFFRER